MTGTARDMTVKVAINGYGTIGKRVADAIMKQDDMTVTGVSKARPTYEAGMAIGKGFRLYAPDAAGVEGFRNAGFECQGTVSDMLRDCDIVVDCLPGKKGIEALPLYREAGVKAIYQGGEKAHNSQSSFSAVANYAESLGKDIVRVVSCNTTGLVRTLYPIHREIGIKKVYATMVRRAVDPRDIKKGPVNSITPVLKVPSHHGPDLQTIIPDVDISTMAVAVPTTLMHLHCNTVVLNREASTDEIISLWEQARRVRLVDGGMGLTSTAELMEYARDLNTERSDMTDIIVWRDGAHMQGDTLYYYQAIHQESDVIPENIDCIRAMTGIEEDPVRSMDKTDAALRS